MKIGFLVAPGLREADAASLDLLLSDPGALSWGTVWSWLRGSSLPLLVGSTIVGLVAGGATFAIALTALGRRRRGGRPPMSDASRRHVA